MFRGGILESVSDQDDIFKSGKAPASATGGKPPAYRAPEYQKPKRQIPWIFIRNIIFFGFVPIGLALEMWAPREYRPSTFMGVRAGQMETETINAAIDAKVDAKNKEISGTIDSQVDAENTRIVGTGQAAINLEAEKAGEMADVELAKAERLKAVMAKLEQKIELSNRCVFDNLMKSREQEIRCMSDPNQSYGHCSLVARQIKNMPCAPLPSAEEYPENLRDEIRQRIASAEKRRADFENQE